MKRTVMQAAGRAAHVALRTPTVAIPATLAAALCAIAFGVVGNVDAAPDWLVVAAVIAIGAGTAANAVVVAAATARRFGGSLETLGRWDEVRRGAGGMVTVFATVLIGITVLAGLRSFLIALFACTLAFMYALPLTATGTNCLASLYASVRLAVQRFGSTSIAAIAIELFAILALSLSDAVWGIPLVGAFLRLLVLELAIGSTTAFTLIHFIAQSELAGASARDVAQHGRSVLWTGHAS